MTDEQKEVFIHMASLGVACGLETPKEWLRNYVRSLVHGPYTEIPTKKNAAYMAFAAFYRTTAGSPEEDDELHSMTDAQLVERYGSY